MGRGCSHLICLDIAVHHEDNAAACDAVVNEGNSLKYHRGVVQSVTEFQRSGEQISSRPRKVYAGQDYSGIPHPQLTVLTHILVEARQQNRWPMGSLLAVKPTVQHKWDTGWFPSGVLCKIKALRPKCVIYCRRSTCQEQHILTQPTMAAVN